MSKLNVDDCPVFDECDVDTSVENIQAWSGFKVDYDVNPVIIGGRCKPRKPLPTYWTMYWERGFMCTGQTELENERYAKVYAALFIFLYCKRVGCGLSDHLADFFVRNLKEYEHKTSNL